MIIESNSDKNCNTDLEFPGRMAMAVDEDAHQQFKPTKKKNSEEDKRLVSLYVFSPQKNMYSIPVCTCLTIRIERKF